MKYFLLLIITLQTLLSFSQKITILGKVLSAKNEALPYVNVLIKETKQGTSTNEKGYFSFEIPKAGKYTIEASSVGFDRYQKQIEATDKTEIQIVLKESANQLKEVVITGLANETFIEDSPVKIEVLTSAFLKTTPNNNVVEALQSVNGVQEQVNCGVCGTNDIHINGMEGPYTLILIDGMPIISALSSVYGFNGIPNSIIDRVEILKGPTSSMFGSEAVGGIINILTKKPDKAPRFSFNVFGTTHQEYNTDIAFSTKVGKRWETLLSLNTYYNQYRIDANKDNFTDFPTNKRVSIFNKWAYKGNKIFQSDIALRFYTEDRFGGEMHWEKENRGENEVYGESIYTNRFEVLNSNKFETQIGKLKIDQSMVYHVQDSYYGTTSYNANQLVYFVNAYTYRKTGLHAFSGGLNYRYQSYEDNSLADTDEKRSIPGLFAQDEFSLTDRTLLQGGMRLDYHVKHGFIWTPKLNIKHQLGKYSTLRLNAGTGFRLVHLFTEDHAALTGSRTVFIKDKLDPERSYNTNLNWNYVFSLGESSGSFDIDAFYIYFLNKIIPDYDTDPNLIIYDNLEGYGISRGLSLNVHQSFKIPFKINIGATLQEVFEMKSEDSQKENQLFTPNIYGTFNLTYNLWKGKTTINYSGRVVGPQLLPEFPAPNSRATVSEPYALQNIQVTQKFKNNWEAYVAVKNLFNYTQDSPLIDYESPFGNSFDTSYAYGPLQTRRLVFGLRVQLF